MSYYGSISECGLFTNLSIYDIDILVPSGEHRWALTVCVSFGKTFGIANVAYQDWDH